MKLLSSLAVLAALAACSTESARINDKTQAATFPADEDWVPMEQAGTFVGDVNTDGNNNGRELVGDATFPAVSIYSDGTDFFIRLRLDDDPSGSGQAVVAPFGWGLLLDTNNNLDDYEFIIIVDGTGADEIVLAQNTSQGTVGDPSDVAENDIVVLPADAGVDGNIRISTADSTFSNTPDFFLDFALPMSALNSVGLDLTDSVRVIAGTSSNGRSLTVDIMSCDGLNGCTLSVGASDPVLLDGSNADSDGDGVPVALDLDDDNDGVPDTAENDLGVDPTGDADADGIPNWLDPDDQGDGSSTCIDADASGLCDAPGPRFDRDGDGIGDHLDVDSDNDGITDLFEAGLSATDANGDGVVDGAVGTNGLLDTLETTADSGTINYAELDTDGDGTVNRQDLDSDGDGVFDINEVGGDALDADDDGRVDSTTDADEDGLMATVDGDETTFGVPAIDPTTFDVDADTIPTPYDVDEDGPGAGDSDGDGTSDDAECPAGFPACIDTDSNGHPDYMGGGACGNGTLEIGEGCDDSGTTPGDGCDANCQVEDGSACNDDTAGNTGDASCASGVCDDVGNAAPGVCEAANTCGNGVLEAGEGCDDGNTATGDGCDTNCDIEDGSACNADTAGDTGDTSCASGICDDVGNAAPGVCEAANTCGNSILEAGEGCDDGNTTAGDGCDTNCDIEDGSACNADAAGDTGDASCASGICDDVGNAAPGVCEAVNSCGNGILEAGEGCDDANTTAGDGCNASCDIENGSACNADAAGDTGNASCASGVCDDVNNPAPGICVSANTCGNGVLEPTEGCDDNGTAPGDGCDANCQIEDGSACNDDAAGDTGDASCASGICDDVGNGAPGVCEAANSCGNSVLEAGEGCDDGNTTAGDGCDTNCDIEDGNACNATAPGDTGNASCASGICDDVGNAAPGSCEPANTCGNSILEAGEGCDDGNTAGGDGCNGGCLIEDGAACNQTAPGLTGDASCLSGSCNVDGGAPGVCESDNDFDGDGILDDVDVDDDNDGILDSVEGTDDTDGDGLIDSLDLDSDDDGISDLVEGDSGCADADEDQICDGPDDDNDGRADDATNDTPPDTDGDGAEDFRDLDSDNDGLSDLVEGNSGCADTSPANSVCDANDGDGDGLADDAAPTLPDSDGDGVSDQLDLDSDNDGLSDLVEVGSGCTDGDTNSVCDGPDSDGDGIVDSIDDTDGHGDENPTVPLDTDGDNTIDALDLDSDDDGNDDADDSGCADADPDDGVCDGGDSDGDGLVDDVDDADGFGSGKDSDGDGIPDATDRDDDNDGITDIVEGNGEVDTDGDGVPDSRDLDSDNDGIVDSIEAGHQQGSPTGPVNCPSGFGRNGMCDDLETNDFSGFADYDGDGVEDLPIDTDGDGAADFRDLDTDGDTISDAIEGGSDCIDSLPEFAVCDGPDSDGDGIPNDIDSDPNFGSSDLGPLPDADGDGIPDVHDTDSDNDTINDIVENGYGQLDSDGDGVSDDDDADGDGLSDLADSSSRFGGGPDAPDSDGDGSPDHTDTDSDGDGIDDKDEAGDDPNDPVDTDLDGVPDFQDADSDDDGVRDDTDNCRFDANSDQEDLDQDGIGAACEEDYEYGLQGGGCSTSGSPSGGLAAMLLLFGLALLARARRALPAFLALALLVVGGSEARAQDLDVDTNYPVERMRLSSDGNGILDVEWAAVTGHKVVDLGLWMGWADDPLNVHRPDANGDRERAGSLVSSRLGGNLVAAVGLWERVQIGMEVPLILYQGQDVGDIMSNISSPSSFGLGDLRLIPKLSLLTQEEALVNVAVSLGFTLPTATSDDYFGENPTFFPEILVSRAFAKGIRLAANIGSLHRDEIGVLDLSVDNEIQARVGIGYDMAKNEGPPVELDLTYSMATPPDDPFGSFNRNYSEAKLGAAYDIKGPLILFAATGVGTSEGFGTPDWRVLTGLRFRQEAELPELPIEELIVEEEPDSDGDGLLDSEDACPAEPENQNGYEDSDGCPDTIPDSDGDGINDLEDSCSDDPEDLDDFEDADGCPELDNDKDGLFDIEDKCVNEPGPRDNLGCPDPDRDGDTVVDRLDNCPDEPGTVEFQGCNKRQLVTITGSNLDILDVVYFRVNKDIILNKSYGLLDNVALVLNAHSEIQKIRVEGHTDSQGNDAYNKKLSQRRAEAVVRYLVNKGVDAGRLEAVGFGEEAPIADNNTKEGRAANRRVEFKIVGEAAGTIENANSGPTEDTLEK